MRLGFVICRKIERGDAYVGRCYHRSHFSNSSYSGVSKRVFPNLYPYGGLASICDFRLCLVSPCHSVLKEETGLYGSVHEKIAERIAENTGSAADAAMTGIPDIIRDILNKAVDSAANAIAQSVSDSLSDLIFNIIGFLVIALAIKLVFFILTMLFSKEKNRGIIGGIDGFFGIFAGALKGLILVYILLALMVPISGLWGSTFLSDGLDSSILGGYLYDNNLILMAVKGLF